jgi:hypothetical protein
MFLLKFPIIEPETPKKEQPLYSRLLKAILNSFP